MGGFCVKKVGGKATAHILTRSKKERWKEGGGERRRQNTERG